MNKSQKKMHTALGASAGIDPHTWLRERVVRVNKSALVLVVIVLTLLLLCTIYFFDQRAHQSQHPIETATEDFTPETSHWYEEKNNAVPGYARVDIDTSAYALPTAAQKYEDDRGNHADNGDDDRGDEPALEIPDTQSQHFAAVTSAQPEQALIEQSSAQSVIQAARDSALSLGAAHSIIASNPLANNPTSPMSGLDAALAQQLKSALSPSSDAVDMPQNHQAAKKQFLQQVIMQAPVSSLQLHETQPQQILSAGTLIPAVLINGIDSDLPGYALAQVRQPVYDSVTGRHVLIPQGSKLLLNYDSEVSFGQKRVLVAVTRLLFPDGTSLNLSAHSVGDLSGYSGFHDQVDNHYVHTFGSAALLGFISGGMQLSQPQPQSSLSNPSAAQIAAGAMGQQLSDVATQTISRQLQVQPSLRIRPGYMFNIIVISDVVLNDNNK